MDITLAEALLRRKELAAKVEQLKTINGKDLYEVKGKRTKVTEDLDDVVLQVPLLASAEVTAAYDFHAKQLRLVDAAIQQANWATKIAVDPTVMADYSAQASKRVFNGKTAT